MIQVVLAAGLMVARRAIIEYMKQEGIRIAAETLAAGAKDLTNWLQSTELPEEEVYFFLIGNNILTTYNENAELIKGKIPQLTDDQMKAIIDSALIDPRYRASSADYAARTEAFLTAFAYAITRSPFVHPEPWERIVTSIRQKQGEAKWLSVTSDAGNASVKPMKGEWKGEFFTPQVVSDIKSAFGAGNKEHDWASNRKDTFPEWAEVSHLVETGGLVFWLSEIWPARILKRLRDMKGDTSLLHYEKHVGGKHADNSALTTPYATLNSAALTTSAYRYPPGVGPRPLGMSKYLQPKFSWQYATEEEEQTKGKAKPSEKLERKDLPIANRENMRTMVETAKGEIDMIKQHAQEGYNFIRAARALLRGDFSSAALVALPPGSHTKLIE
jgi:hypothetical protein